MARLLLMIAVVLVAQGGTVVVDRPVLASAGEVTGTTEPGVMVYIFVYRELPQAHPEPMLSDEDGRFRFVVDLSDAIGVNVSLVSGSVRDYVLVERRVYLPAVAWGW